MSEIIAAQQLTVSPFDAIRRYDLLVPIRRQAVSEYVSPDRLEEAISVVYGNSRQKLLGE